MAVTLDDIFTTTQEKILYVLCLKRNDEVYTYKNLPDDFPSIGRTTIDFALIELYDAGLVSQDNTITKKGVLKIKSKLDKYNIKVAGINISDFEEDRNFILLKSKEGDKDGFRRR